MDLATAADCLISDGWADKLSLKGQRLARIGQFLDLKRWRKICFMSFRHIHDSWTSHPRPSVLFGTSTDQYFWFPASFSQQAFVYCSWILCQFFEHEINLSRPSPRPWRHSLGWPAMADTSSSYACAQFSRLIFLLSGGTRDPYSPASTLHDLFQPSDYHTLPLETPAMSLRSSHHTSSTVPPLVHCAAYLPRLFLTTGAHLHGSCTAASPGQAYSS